MNYNAHNTNCNAVKLSVKSLFRYDQDILSSALNERPQPSPGPSNNNPNYKLRVLVLKFFIRKMPSGFSNSSLKRRKQWTVCFPIVMREIRSFSWATIRLVFTKLSYSDPLFCRFLRPEIVHSGTCFAINSNFAWFLTSHFPVVWCFDNLLFSREKHSPHRRLVFPPTPLSCFTTGQSTVKASLFVKYYCHAHPPSQS